MQCIKYINIQKEIKLIQQIRKAYIKFTNIKKKFY